MRSKMNIFAAKTNADAFNMQVRFCSCKVEFALHALHY